MIRDKFISMLLLFSLNVSASDISIGTLYDYMSEKNSIFLKKVKNLGNETAFVKIMLSEIIYSDGIPEEVELPEEGVRQFIASPSRLIIPAGGVQATRFIYMGAREKERYFRVRFIPVQPEGDEVTQIPLQQHVSAGVSITSGFGAILFVAPGETRYDTRIEREGGALYVENKGNATVILDYLVSCGKKNTSCSHPIKVHLLPGVKRKVGEDAVHSVRFELIEGGKSTIKAFKA